MKPIWIIDDDRSIRWVFEKALARTDMEFKTFASVPEAMNALNNEEPQVVVSDIRMPNGSGLDFLQEIKQRLPDVPVIIKEADRLQSLMDRLLVPHRVPKYEPTNIHEVLERVRSLLLAESPKGVVVQRDYDTSLPELIGDREKLIQAVLNIARNAVQAMQGKGRITLRTRAERQVTLAKQRYRVAIKLQIIDNGPGIPPDIRAQQASQSSA